MTGLTVNVKRGVAVLMLPVFFFAAGCGEESTGQVREQTERFVTALYDGDRSTLSTIAPALVEEGEEGLTRLFKTIRNYPDWRIEKLEREGNRASAAVRFSRDDTHLNLTVPLSYNGEQWKVEKEIEFSATLDFVPLE